MDKFWLKEFHLDPMFFGMKNRSINFPHPSGMGKMAKFDIFDIRVNTYFEKLYLGPLLSNRPPQKVKNDRNCRLWMDGSDFFRPYLQ